MLIITYKKFGIFIDQTFPEVQQQTCVFLGNLWGNSLIFFSIFATLVVQVAGIAPRCSNVDNHRSQIKRRTFITSLNLSIMLLKKSIALMILISIKRKRKIDKQMDRQTDRLTDR